MSHKLLNNANFHDFLSQLDSGLAQKCQEQGCQHCSGLLHQADYPRSPFGLPLKHREHYLSRLSFCCKTCRKRITPPSVRFFGRRWFPAPVFMLICLLRSGVSERRLTQIKRHFRISVSISTWHRWRRWWRERFELTQFWQASKGLVTSTLNEHKAMPRALLDCFKDEPPERLSQLLVFLSPLSRGY